MSNPRGAGIASFVGTSIEWYDFYMSARRVPVEV